MSRVLLRMLRSAEKAELELWVAHAFVPDSDRAAAHCYLTGRSKYSNKTFRD
jgi:hypothetical protein